MRNGLTALFKCVFFFYDSPLILPASSASANEPPKKVDEPGSAIYADSKVAIESIDSESSDKSHKSSMKSPSGNSPSQTQSKKSVRFEKDSEEAMAGHAVMKYMSAHHLTMHPHDRIRDGFFDAGRKYGIGTDDQLIKRFQNQIKIRKDTATTSAAAAAAESTADKEQPRELILIDPEIDTVLQTITQTAQMTVQYKEGKNNTLAHQHHTNNQRHNRLNHNSIDTIHSIDAVNSIDAITIYLTVCVIYVCMCVCVCVSLRV
jgi:hypothetical protein